MESAIQSVKGSTPAPGDIYWQVLSDRVWVRGANSTTYTEHPRVAAPGASGSIRIDGQNKQILIYDGASTLRVKLGNLSV
jgi:hypothetical protein